MFKLFFFLPLAAASAFALVLGSALLLPLLGFGIALAAVGIAVGVLVLVFRVLAALLVGVGSLLFGAVLIGGLVACAAVVLALGAALAHLIVPLLAIFAVVWFAKAMARPAPPAIGRS